MNSKLPCNECKGRCCTYPAFSEAELQLVKIVKGIPPKAIIQPLQQVTSYLGVSTNAPGFVLHNIDGTCPYFLNNKCSIYEIRPQTCKDYGVHKELPCEYLYPKESKFYQDQRIKRARGENGQSSTGNRKP